MNVNHWYYYIITICLLLLYNSIHNNQKMHNNIYIYLYIIIYIYIYQWFTLGRHILGSSSGYAIAKFYTKSKSIYYSVSSSGYAIVYSKFDLDFLRKFAIEYPDENPKLCLPNVNHWYI